VQAGVSRMFRGRCDRLLAMWGSTV